MMQQWQQMPEQQKKLAIVLAVVIVLALVLIVWQLMLRRPATTTQEGEHMQEMLGEHAPEFGEHAPGMFEEQMTAPGMEMPPGMMGQVGVPTVPTGGPTMGVPTGVPGMGAPTPAPAGKLENPPRPGRNDPFADLPSSGGVSPFTPIVLPPTPEPVVLARAQAGSIGIETFSLQNTETNIPTPQPQIVDLRSYFERPQQQPQPDQTEELLKQIEMLRSRFQQPQLSQAERASRPPLLQPIRAKRELPNWRLVGVILTESSIGIIVQTPDGRTRAVRIGDSISYGGVDYTVTQVEEQRVILRDSTGGEHILTRQPETAPPIPPLGGISSFGPGGY